MAHKVLVGRLPVDITNEELSAVFNTYGSVASIEVAGSDPSGARQAWVAYAERRSAEDAIEVLHDSYKIRVDADQPIQVSWPKDTSMEAAWGSPSKPAGMSGSIDMAPNSTHNDEGFKLFVGGLPEDVTEEKLRWFLELMEKLTVFT